MTVTITKPSFNLRDALVSLKRKIGIKGAELMAAETVSDVYSVIGTNRNLLINGNFDIWQRGTSLSPAGTVFRITDGFLSSTGSGGITTASRQLVTTGDDPIAGTSKYYYRHNQTTGNASNGRLSQYIENVMQFSGKTITLSFYAKANANIAGSNGILDVYFQLSYGTGGSPTATDYIGGGGAFGTSLSSGIVWGDLNTGWKKYSVTVSVPSLIGKTLGTNNDDYLMFQIRMPPTITYIIDFAQVQLEIGSVATPFETRSYSTELALCQRYLLVDTSMSNYNLFGFGVTNSTTNASINRFFPVEMRAAPSLTVSNVTGFIVDCGSIAPATTNIVLGIITKTHARIIATVASGLSITQNACLLVNDSSGTVRSLIYSAELS